MNEHYVSSFVKQAQAVGMPQQKIAQLLDKAMEISSRGSVKTAAENHLDQIVSGLLQQAGLDKTASSVAYTNGILKEALDRGASPEQAVQLTKHALNQTTSDLAVMGKMASISQNQEHAFYAEGFIKAAMHAGMSQADATRALVGLFEREKRAGGGEELFKQTGVPGGPPGMPPGGPQDGDPSDPTGGGDPSQGGPAGPGGQIPPELLMQLLQMLAQQQQGGQGGPPGGGMMPPPGGPPGMPPGGAGGPPPGMPPGGPH